MKKTLLLLTAIISFSCSTDDEQDLISEPITEEPEERVYRMFHNYSNIENWVIKTKTGNGQWVEQQLYSDRFPIRHGDSLHVYSRTNSYIPNSLNVVNFQVHNVSHILHPDNASFTFRAQNAPVNAKAKIVFPEYEDYPKWDSQGNPIFD